MMFELCNKGRNILPKKRYKKYSRETEGFKADVSDFFNNNKQPSLFKQGRFF